MEIFCHLGCFSDDRDIIALMKKEVKNCPQCGEEVLIIAKKCKHCGSDLRTSFVKHPTGYILLIFLALILLFILSSSGSGTNYEDIPPGQWSREKCNQNAKERIDLLEAPLVINLDRVIQLSRKFDKYCKRFN